MDLKLGSPAFKEGEHVPDKYTCNGENLSPELFWGKGDPAIKSFALILDDPDAPRATFTHWVIYNLPGTLTGLPQNVPPKEKLSNGGLQGKNDAMKIGYIGPCPPPGPIHHYNFRLYGLDSVLSLLAGATKQQLLDAIKGHVIAESRLTGLYQRR
jgi:Raf kinase inhibitor-like YbhB/YbcL family protein